MRIINDPWWFLLCFYLLAVPAVASFFDHSAPSRRKTDSNKSATNLDLVEFLNARNSHRDNVFSDAIKVLESMRSSPSCNRIAAAKLLTSCQDLNDRLTVTVPDVPTMLDRVKSIYAARLALCELGGAGKAIPAACASLQVNPDTSRNSIWSKEPQILDSGFDSNVPTNVLEACLGALESRPQWWTSYSNSRQNALVICQAARTEVEKEEMLSLHRSLADNSAKLNKGLQEALRNAATDTSQHRVFVEATEVMRAELLREMEQDGLRTQNIFGRILKEVETTMSEALMKLLSTIRNVEVDATVLGEGLQSSSNGVDELQRRLHEFHDEATLRNEGLAEIQEQTQRLAHNMKSSFDSLISNDMARLSERVVNVDGAMDWMAQRFALIHRQEHLILEQLQSFQAQLKVSKSQAEELLETQTLHADAMETHSRAQEALRASAKVTQALLEKLGSKAANLEAVLEDTANKVNDLPMLSDVFGIRVSPWTLCLVLFSAIAIQNPKFAVLIFIGFGGYLTSKAISYAFPLFFQNF